MNTVEKDCGDIKCRKKIKRTTFQPIKLICARGRGRGKGGEGLERRGGPISPERERESRRERSEQQEGNDDRRTSPIRRHERNTQHTNEINLTGRHLGHFQK